VWRVIEVQRQLALDELEDEQETGRMAEKASTLRA